MKKENITIYSCEHCSKISRGASAMIAHEKSCKNNPANINACVGCKFLESTLIVNSFYDDEENYNTFNCSKLN